MTPDTVVALQRSGVVVAIILTGIGAARLLRFAAIPAMIVIAAVGVGSAALLPQRLQPELDWNVLGAFLPALIFEAAWDADAAALREAAVPITMLAVPGTLVTALIVAAFAVASHSMGYATALVLGSILAATDPVTVLATFRRLALPTILVTIVEGESVANDGVALVLVQTLIPIVLGGRPDAAPLALAVRAVWAMAGGIVLGAILAFPVSLAWRRRAVLPVRIACTVVLAYGAYAIATATGTSGIFATASAGIALRFFTKDPPDNPDALRIDRAWDAIAFACNALIFALVGLTLHVDRLAGGPAFLASVVVAVVLARGLLAYVVVPLQRIRGASAVWRHAIALAGLRGGLSLAIAVSLPRDFPQRGAVTAATFAVVFLTLLLQGPLIAPLLRRVSGTEGHSATTRRA